MVLAVQAIAAELARLGSHPYLREPLPASESRDEKAVLKDIFAALGRVSGVDFSGYKMATIRRRVERRMAVNKLTGLDQYADFLATHPAETDSLYQDILIMVTDFFRDPPPLPALREQALPRLLRDRPEATPLRIWVPGCASGEEAYSIAIELVEYLHAHQLSHALQAVCHRHQRARLSPTRGAPSTAATAWQTCRPSICNAYFSAAEDGYEVREEIREACVFARHDVTRDAPFFAHRPDQLPQPADLPGGGATGARAAYVPLRPATRGLLMLGSSESVGAAKDLFQALDAKQKLYLRRQTKARLPVEFATRRRARRLPPPRRSTARRTPRRRLFRSTADRRFAGHDKTRPAGRRGRRRASHLQFRGDTDAYLAHRSGEPTLDLPALAREGLESALRGVIAEAGRVARRPCAGTWPSGAQRRGAHRSAGRTPR